MSNKRIHPLVLMMVVLLVVTGHRSADGHFTDQPVWTSSTSYRTAGIAVGDVNLDGKVNIFDLVLVAKNFAKTAFDPIADVNGDNLVNIFDLVFVVKHFS